MFTWLFGQKRTEAELLRTLPKLSTLPKFNSSPLKIGRLTPPKRKRNETRLPTSTIYNRMRSKLCPSKPHQKKHQHRKIINRSQIDTHWKSRTQETCVFVNFLKETLYQKSMPMPTMRWIFLNSSLRFL